MSPASCECPQCPRDRYSTFPNAARPVPPQHRLNLQRSLPSARFSQRVSVENTRAGFRIGLSQTSGYGNPSDNPLDFRRLQLMAIGSSTWRRVNQLRADNHIPLRGAVIEIGAQQLVNSFLDDTDEHAISARLFQTGRPLPSLARSKAAHLTADAPHSQIIWQWIGYEYACIDIDGTEHSLPLDLNYDKVPRRHVGRYDLVTNFGTTEHVANQLNAFEIIHTLTKPGGVMFHEVPSQGYLMHGLINYNPKFFWILARSNNYRWLHMDFSIDPAERPLQEDIVAEVRRHNGDTGSLRSYSTKDCGIVVALQKTNGQKFIAPFDVNTGAKTNNKALRKRYPTVFSS